jgi:hypothetical protein
MSHTWQEPDEAWPTQMSFRGRKIADTVASEKTGLDVVGLVEAWVSSVRRIVSGLGDDYYDDYYGFLSWREGIEEVIATLPDFDKLVVQRAIAVADNSFRENTIDDGGAALSRKFSVQTEDWYWRRIPMFGPIARSLGLRDAGA